MKNNRHNRPAGTLTTSHLHLSMTHAMLFAAFVLLCMLVAPAAQADELHLLLNGKAKHISPRPNTEYNERNWGGGFQYEYGRRTSLWVPFVTVSGFIDSLENPSYYAGGGMLRRYLISRKMEYLHFDVGVVGFVMTREDFYNGRPFLGALPVFSFGTDKISMNVTYVPAVDKRMAELWFMQLKVSSKNFW